MWYTVKFQMANSIDFAFSLREIIQIVRNIWCIFREYFFFILERWFSGYIPLVRHWVLLRLMVVVTMEINISFHVCKLDKNRVKHFIKKTTNELTVVKLSFCNRLSSTFLFIIQFWQHWIVFFSIGCHWSEQHNSKSVMKSNSYFNNKDK